MWGELMGKYGRPPGDQLMGKYDRSPGDQINSPGDQPTQGNRKGRPYPGRLPLNRESQGWRTWCRFRMPGSGLMYERRGLGRAARARLLRSGGSAGRRFLSALVCFHGGMLGTADVM